MEQNQLTTEQIARVFVMYMPCWVKCGKLAGWKDSQKNARCDIHYYVNNWDRGLLLQLKPISAISDEHAIEVAKIEGLVHAVLRRHDNRVGLHDELYMLNIYFDGDMELWHNGNVTRQAAAVPAYQYLVSKGYAVPLFFAPGHPLNGKTAIEIGLAIDSTQSANTPSL